MRIAVLLASLTLTAPVAAADRTVGVGSFDRLRVEGPFEVVVTTGSPTARVTGDADAIRAVDVRQDGTTLTIRRGAGSGLRSGTTAPVRIALATPALAAASSAAGARLTIARLRGQRIDLTVAGAGAIDAGAIDGAEVVAILAGAGRLTLAGRTPRARLVKNGEGSIDAAALDAGDLFVAADGLGPLTARARYTAQVGNAGTGEVTITGAPKCTIRPGGGPILCGVNARP